MFYSAFSPLVTTIWFAAGSTTAAALVALGYRTAPSGLSNAMALID